MLSILLPSYNNKCYTLVECLQQQAAAIEGLLYEIIVADDGSKDQVSVISNLRINELPHCRYIRRQENVGRAAIRNFLAREAKGERLLFLDSDVAIVRNDFLCKYLATEAEVVDGGVEVPAMQADYCLRYLYEKKSEPRHTSAKRTERPYQSFRTSNFMVHRSLFDRCSFDENFRNYGYEDVLFGKQLQKLGIPILHIDNPVGLDVLESNEVYVQKMEQAMQTLYQFREELQGYSPLLDAVGRLQRWHMLWAVRLWHWCLGGWERRNLCSQSPSLRLLNLYKLGYYVTRS